MNSAEQNKTELDCTKLSWIQLNLTERNWIKMNSAALN